MATILVVDDDQIIRDLSKELLNLLGYEVCTAQGGDVALKIVSTKNKNIDLVILDISLPDINGLELFPKLLAKRPNLKILLSSGNFIENSDKLLKKKGIVGILQKPYEFNVLKSTLEKVLTSS